MSQKLKVNVISESTFTVQGHGVHTAFVEMVNALKARPDVDVTHNKFRRADITHIHTMGVYSLLHLLFGAGKKVVVAHLVPDSLIGSIKGAHYLQWFTRAYMRFFYKRADLLCAVSDQTAAILRDELHLTNRIIVMYNTIDTAQYATSPAAKTAARRALGIASDAFVVVGSGQIQPRKRFDTFCRLATECPDMQFIWVGGIPFRRLGAGYADMQDLLQDPPRNVTITGVVPLSDVKPYLQAANIMCMPSRQETFGLSLVEGAACGLPIVVRDIPDYDATFGQDVVRATEASFVTVLRTLQRDKVAYQKAVAASGRIAKRYDSIAGGERLVNEYTNLICSKKITARGGV